MSFWKRLFGGADGGTVPKQTAAAVAPREVVKPRVKINQAGIDLIKGFESLALKPYTDLAGHLTIGYGHKILPGERFSIISKTEAENILIDDLEKAEKQTDALLSVKLNPNQYAAIISFVFNLGSGAFRGSTLRKHLNAGDFNAAAGQFHRWVYAGAAGKKIKYKGLIVRREAERKLFIS